MKMKVHKNNAGREGMEAAAMQRSNIYKFLSLIYMSEVTEILLRKIKETEVMSTLVEMGARFEDDVLHQYDKKLIEDLAVEYARLFLGPGRHISPHESVHHERDDGDWGRLWGADTVVVKKFIETAGLEYKVEYTGLPDHIGTEFEFMGEVIKREAEAWQNNDREGAVYCLKIEKKFIEEHLAGWIPVFCDKVIAQAELSFYREIARLTKSFLESEIEEIENYLMQARE